VPTSEDLEIVLLTLRVAGVATALLLVPGVLAGFGLARYRGPGRGALETVLALPLVLPPTAIGIVLLEALSPRHGPGAWLAARGLDLVFTWRGAVLAATVMASPLLVRSARTAFEEVDPRLVAMARTLGCTLAAAFVRVTLPLARRGILAGVVLAFSRALGEFGATIMIAGSIPGRTRTLALAIFQEHQVGDDAEAFRLVGITVLLAFGALWLAEWVGRRGVRAR
jgi:molybdate transport system permease protein